MRILFIPGYGQSIKGRKRVRGAAHDGLSQPREAGQAEAARARSPMTGADPASAQEEGRTGRSDSFIKRERAIASLRVELEEEGLCSTSVIAAAPPSAATVLGSVTSAGKEGTNGIPLFTGSITPDVSPGASRPPRPPASSTPGRRRRASHTGQEQSSSDNNDSPAPVRSSTDGGSMPDSPAASRVSAAAVRSRPDAWCSSVLGLLPLLLALLFNIGWDTVGEVQAVCLDMALQSFADAVEVSCVASDAGLRDGSLVHASCPLIHKGVKDPATGLHSHRGYKMVVSSRMLQYRVRQVPIPISVRRQAPKAQRPKGAKALPSSPLLPLPLLARPSRPLSTPPRRHCCALRRDASTRPSCEHSPPILPPRCPTPLLDCSRPPTPSSSPPSYPPSPFTDRSRCHASPCALVLQSSLQRVPHSGGSPHRPRYESRMYCICFEAVWSSKQIELPDHCACDRTRKERAPRARIPPQKKERPRLPASLRTTKERPRLPASLRTTKERPRARIAPHNKRATACPHRSLPAVSPPRVYFASPDAVR